MGLQQAIDDADNATNHALEALQQATTGGLARSEKLGEALATLQNSFGSDVAKAKALAAAAVTAATDLEEAVAKVIPLGDAALAAAAAAETASLQEAATTTELRDKAKAARRCRRAGGGVAGTGETGV